MLQTDNRLLASAVRHVIEPFIAGRITGIQRGFVAGRSMIANLINVDESLALHAMDGDMGGWFSLTLRPRSLPSSTTS